MRDRIIRSAMEQIGKFGLRRFTIDDIAADLGISKKTVYKHFTSKKELVSAVVEAYHQLEVDRTSQALETEGSWLDKLGAVICCQPDNNVPTWLLEELQRFFPEEWAKSEVISSYKREQVQKLLTLGIQEGEVRPDVNRAVLGLTLHKTILALFDYNFLNQNEMTVNQALDEFRKIIFYGILNPKGKSEECQA